MICTDVCSFCMRIASGLCPLLTAVSARSAVAASPSRHAMPGDRRASRPRVEACRHLWPRAERSRFRGKVWRPSSGPDMAIVALKRVGIVSWCHGGNEVGAPCHSFPLQKSSRAMCATLLSCRLSRKSELFLGEDRAAGQDVGPGVLAPCNLF